MRALGLVLVAHVALAAPMSTKPIQEELVEKHPHERARIERGLAQCAKLWRDSDGDLAAFAREQFVPSGPELDQTFARLEYILEQTGGHLHEIGRELRRGSELDEGPLLPVDPLLAAWDPQAHLSDDLFSSKIAFVALLNFPLTTLTERTANARKWTRKQWAEARLTDHFARRVPAEVTAEQARVAADADLYVANYNIWMHHVVGEHGERPFPKGMRLIAHWNLRDELKADYADGDKARGLLKQRMILQVMERIVTQTIPQAVIDDPRVDWEPFSNRVEKAPEAEVETDRPFKKPLTVDAAREPDVRWAKLLAQFQAARRADPYSPTAPTAIGRMFEIERELPEARVKALLEEILGSKLVPRVAALIEKRLGRKLGPQDLWYDGFQARSSIGEEQLDAITRKRYPTADAFAADIPRILTDLGFAPDKAKWVASHIVVDPSRGAGHALEAARRGDQPHLRTRIEPGGMNYKGYNIAVHELGHNVEQVFSLYEVDHTLLASVPGNSFTEALAFLFQARDLELLGLQKPTAESERMRVLNDFWGAWEIAGVSLVDLATWHWMYDHPGATPPELREAVVKIARETWNKWYAPVLGGRDSALLGIYSHMIAYPLYLADYPLGHAIAFQIEEHVAHATAGGKLGPEFERMAKFGRETPDAWMENATGAPVSAGPLLRATERALGKSR